MKKLRFLGYISIFVILLLLGAFKLFNDGLYSYKLILGNNINTIFITLAIFSGVELIFQFYYFKIKNARKGLYISLILLVVFLGGIYFSRPARISYCYTSVIECNEDYSKCSYKDDKGIVKDNLDCSKYLKDN